MSAALFRGSQAIAAGRLTRNDLRLRHRAVFRDIYIRRDTALTAADRARAAGLATGAVLAHTSAAALLGTKWLSADAAVHVIRADRHPPRGIIVHSWRLDECDICRLNGVTLTTPVRTAFDIGRTLSSGAAIPVLDALCRATGLTPAQVAAYAEQHAGARGVRRLRSMLPLVDGGAESPPETRVRLLLIAGGLPPPQTQIEFPQLRIRVDMGWSQWRVAVEYDGVQHWTDARQRAWDIERLALLEAHGWVVVRVSAAMLAAPDAVVARVRDKLRAAGCPL